MLNAKHSQPRTPGPDPWLPTHRWTPNDSDTTPWLPKGIHYIYINDDYILVLVFEWCFIHRTFFDRPIEWVLYYHYGILNILRLNSVRQILAPSLGQFTNYCNDGSLGVRTCHWMYHQPRSLLSRGAAHQMPVNDYWALNPSLAFSLYPNFGLPVH